MEKLGNVPKVLAKNVLEVYNAYLWPPVSTVLLARPAHFFYTRFVSDIKPGDKVLELCSGYPWYELYADKVGDNGTFIALDVSQSIQTRSKFLGKVVDKYIRRKKEPTVQHLVASAYTTLPFRNNTFDHVMVSQSKIREEEVYRVLKPGGKLLVSFAEALTLPVSTLIEYGGIRGSKFENAKLHLGMPATGFFALGYYLNTGHIPDLSWALVGFNWYLSATKPNSRKSRRTRR